MLGLLAGFHPAVLKPAFFVQQHCFHHLCKEEAQQYFLESQLIQKGLPAFAAFSCCSVPLCQSQIMKQSHQLSKSGTNTQFDEKPLVWKGCWARSIVTAIKALCLECSCWCWRGWTGRLSGCPTFGCLLFTAHWLSQMSVLVTYWGEIKPLHVGQCTNCSLSLMSLRLPVHAGSEAPRPSWGAQSHVPISTFRFRRCCAQQMKLAFKYFLWLEQPYLSRRSAWCFQGLPFALRSWTPVYIKVLFLHNVSWSCIWINLGCHSSCFSRLG